MWAIAVSAIGAVLGWATLVGATIWYWKTVVPDLYDDESVLPFVLTMVFAAVLYFAIFIGAWRRFAGFRDGMPTMLLSTVTLGALIIATLTISGILLVPSFIVSTLAPALPAGMREQPVLSSAVEAQ
jgi:hypothetical protein